MNHLRSLLAFFRWLLSCASLVAVGAIVACVMTSPPAANSASSSSTATTGTQVARTDDTTTHVTTTEATEEDETAPTPVPAMRGDNRPAVDSADAVAVASAFITELSTRWPEEPSDSWYQRWSQWATPALASVWEDRGADAYRNELDRRHGWSIGTVVGTANGTCAQTSCVVYTVLDQALVVDSGTPVADTYATWRLTLLHGPDGWRVDSLDDGSPR